MMGKREADGIAAGASEGLLELKDMAALSVVVERGDGFGEVSK